MASAGGEESALRAAALDHWPRAAGARVAAVRIDGVFAEVVVVLSGGYDYWMYFTLSGGAWVLQHDGNGPSWTPRADLGRARPVSPPTGIPGSPAHVATRSPAGGAGLGQRS